MASKKELYLLARLSFIYKENLLNVMRDKMSIKHLLAVLTVFLICAACFSNKTEATSCGMPNCTDIYKGYELFFRGRAVKTEKLSFIMKRKYAALESKRAFPGKEVHYPDTYTEFEVTKVLKGVPGERIKILYKSNGNANHYETGKEFRVVANYRSGFYLTSVGRCGTGCLHDGSSLEVWNNKLDAIDKQIRSDPANLQLYFKKTATLEEFNDFARAVPTYHLALANVPSGQLDKDFYLRFGRALYETRQYKEALGVLQPYRGAECDADGYSQLSLIKLGKMIKLDGERLCLPGKHLDNISFQHLKLQKSDFTGAVLSNVKFQDTDLSGSHFSEAKLRSVEFRDTVLSDAVFSDASIEFARAWSSDFSHANFQKARVSFYDLFSSNFSNASFEDAVFYMQNYDDLKFSEVNFSKATVHSIGGTNISDSDFTGATFFAANLPGSRGKNNDLDLSGQRLDKANFYGSDLTNTRFEESSLRNAVFSGAIMVNTSFRKADLTGATFSGLHSYFSADISGADFSSAVITDVNWVGVKYDCLTKFPEGFDPLAHMMKPTNENCQEKVGSPNFSRESLLYPPDRHYRLWPKGSFTDFTALDLKGIGFEGIDFRGLPDSRVYTTYPSGPSRVPTMRFDGSNLQGADFRNTAGSAVFRGANLSGADFSFSALKRTSFFEKSANSGRASIKNAKFYCAQLDGWGTGSLFKKQNGSNDETPAYLVADLTAAVLRNIDVKKMFDDTFNPLNKRILYPKMQQLIDQYGAANYTDMNFNRCNLSEIDFGTTNLSGSSFQGANLGSVDFSAAKLANTKFDGALINIATKFPAGFDTSQFQLVPIALFTGFTRDTNAQLSYEVLSTKLKYLEEFLRGHEDVDLSKSDLDRVNFERTWLPRANFYAANLRFSSFLGANLEGANLIKADATGAVFTNANLKNVHFVQTNLEGADLIRADLTGARLEGANLKNAIFTQDTVWPEGFSPIEAGAVLIK